MFTLVLIASIVIYVKFSKKIVTFLARYGRAYKIAAIIFFSLLPFVDVLAGYVAYYYICIQKAGRSVYAKTSPPISVCVDDSGMSYGIYVHGITDVTQDRYLFNLVSSVYTNVNKTSGRSIAESPGLNKYEIDEEGILRAKAVNEKICEYDYIEEEEKLLMLPVYVTTSVLLDHNNKRIFAKNVNVKIKYLGIYVIPYFNWIKWYDQYYVKEYNYDRHKFKNIVTATAVFQ
jgi:hypothetical protein